MQLEWNHSLSADGAYGAEARDRLIGGRMMTCAKQT